MSVSSIRSLRLPVISAIGAAKSFYEFPITEWRDTRPIPHSRQQDQFCASPVCGDSLNGDGIFDGDYVILRLTFERHEIKQGQLVAVFTPYGLLLKHIYFTLNKKVRLVSANTEFEDILLDAEEVNVQGIVVRIERDL